MLCLTRLFYWQRLLVFKGSCCCCLQPQPCCISLFFLFCFFYSISQKARVVTGQSHTAKTNHLWLKWSGPNHVWHDGASVLHKVTKFVVELGKTLTVTPSSWLDPDNSSWPHCVWDMIAWLHCVNTVKPTHIYYLFRAVSQKWYDSINCLGGNKSIAQFCSELKDSLTSVELTSANSWKECTSVLRSPFWFPKVSPFCIQWWIKRNKSPFELNKIRPHTKEGHVAVTLKN